MPEPTAAGSEGSVCPRAASRGRGGDLGSGGRWGGVCRETGQCCDPGGSERGCHRDGTLPGTSAVPCTCAAAVPQPLSSICPRSERRPAGELHGLRPVLGGQWLHHLPPPALPAHLEGRHPPVRDVRPHLSPRLLRRAGAGGQQMHKYVPHQPGSAQSSQCPRVPLTSCGSQHPGEGDGCVSCSIPGITEPGAAARAGGSQAVGLPPLFPRPELQPRPRRFAKGFGSPVDSGADGSGLAVCQPSG